jgi:hypothetical protein
MVVSILTITGLVLAIAVSVMTLIRLFRTERKIQEVHVLVNSQLSKVLARVTQLTSTLEEADIEIPESPEDE